MLRRITDEDDDGQLVSTKTHHIDDMLTAEGYKVPTHKKGAKLFADIDFPKSMTDAEIGKMTRLSKLMVSTSNMLGYRKNNSILPYSEQHIIDLLNMSGKRGKGFVRKMIKLEVMQKTTRTICDLVSVEYYINPAYFFAGKRISLNLYLLFREALDPILPVWVRKEFLSAAKEQEKPAKREADNIYGFFNEWSKPFDGDG